MAAPATGKRVGNMLAQHWAKCSGKRRAAAISEMNLLAAKTPRLHFHLLLNVCGGWEGGRKGEE